MAKHAILGAEFVFPRAQRDLRQRGAATMKTLVLSVCYLFMAGCATALPGVLSDFSEMKAEVSVPIWRNPLFEPPYAKILESASPVAERHCASVGGKPVFVSMRGADMRSAVRSAVVVAGTSNTGEALVLYRCEKQRDDDEESVRLALAAISPEFVVQVWDTLSESERRALKDDEHFRRALEEGSRQTVFVEMERVLSDVRQTPQASSGTAAATFGGRTDLGA